MLFHAGNPRDFSTGTFAGLDECLPTVGQCDWINGRSVADHGEFWSIAWEVREFRAGLLVMTAWVPEFGLELTRMLSISGATIRFIYHLRNRGREPAPALWAMHPLFTMKSGDRLELPAHIQRLRLATTQSGRNGVITVPFPEIAPGVYLDRWELPDVQSGMLKAFTDASPAPTGVASIRNGISGETLRLTWDAQAAPYLGVWVTRGGHNGWHHAALEPTNAPFDRVDHAYENGFSDAVTLAVGKTRRWWVEWRLSKS